MTKKSLLFSLLIILLFSSIPSLVQAEVIKISNTPGMAELPNIICMKDGNIMIVYCEGHHFNGDAIMYYHIYNQQSKSWSAPKVAVKRYYSSAYCQLVDDEEGNIHMAYHDGNSSSNREVYYAKYDINKQSWGSRHLVYSSAGTNSTWPRIQYHDGMIYYAWSHNYSPPYEMDITMVESPVNGPWPVPKANRLTISNTDQSVSIHNDFAYKDGKVYCVWMDDLHKPGNWNMYYNDGTYNPNNKTWSFGDTQHLFPSNASQYYPALAVDDAGLVHVIYSNKANPMWYTRYNGTTWTGPKAISTGGTNQNMFAVLKYAKGLLHAVLRQGLNVYYVRGLTDGTWAEPVKIHDGQTPGYPGLSVDSAGDAHVVFSDGDEDHPRNVYYTKVNLPGNPPTAVLNASRTNGLLPLTVKFNANGSSDSDGQIRDYRWSFGDGATATGKAVSHTFQLEGTFTVSLTVLDNDMRIGTAEVQIEVTSGTPKAVIEASATQGMIPLIVEFDGSNSTDFDGTIVSYWWELGDGTSSAEPVVVHTYENGGDYTVKLTVRDNDDKIGTATVEITVYEKPEAVFTADPVIGKAPLRVAFDATPSFDPDGTIETYRWDFGDGMQHAGPKPVHTYSTPGTFMVVLTVKDDDDIYDTETVEIRVLDRPLAPVGVSVQQFTNKSFLFTDTINVVSWQDNPENSGLFTIAGYNIYRKSLTSEAPFVRIAEVGASTLSYEDRGFSNSQEASNYEYAIAAVDGDGMESLLSQSGIPAAVTTGLKVKTNLYRK